MVTFKSGFFSFKRMAALNPDRPKLMRTWRSDKGDARTSTDNNDVAWLLFLHSVHCPPDSRKTIDNFPPFLFLPQSHGASILGQRLIFSAISSCLPLTGSPASLHFRWNCTTLILRVPVSWLQCILFDAEAQTNGRVSGKPAADF